MAKFIPGLGTLAPPFAGNSGVNAARFVFFDGVSSVLHGGCFILVGVLFSQQLEQIINALAGLGRSAFGVVAGFAALYISYRYFQRHRLLSGLRMARITVEELYQKQEVGEQLVILDLRQQVELEPNPSVIRGALHMTTDEVEHRHQEILRDRDILLYCSCPNEVTSAPVHCSFTAMAFRVSDPCWEESMLGEGAITRRNSAPPECQERLNQLSASEGGKP